MTSLKLMFGLIWTIKGSSYDLLRQGLKDLVQYDRPNFGYTFVK